MAVVVLAMTNDSVNWGSVVLVVQYGTGSPPVWLLAVVCRAWAIPNVPGSTPSNSAAALVWREKLLLSLNGRRSSRRGRRETDPCYHTPWVCGPECVVPDNVIDHLRYRPRP